MDAITRLKKLRECGLSLKAIGKLYGVSKQAIYNRLLEHPPQQVKDSAVIKKHLANPLLPLPAKIILKYCLNNNLRIGEAMNRLGFHRSTFNLISCGKIKRKRVYVPLKDYLKPIIANINKANKMKGE